MCQPALSVPGRYLRLARCLRPAGTVVGIGRNHPPQFVNGNEFHPATPLLPGAVMYGLGGTPDDQPFMGDAIYNVSEYWTPMVSYTLWLMALLQSS